jgi:hypothetical protein
MLAVSASREGAFLSKKSRIFLLRSPLVGPDHLRLRRVREEMTDDRSSHPHAKLQLAKTASRTARLPGQYIG